MYAALLLSLSCLRILCLFVFFMFLFSLSLSVLSPTHVRAEVLRLEQELAPAASRHWHPDTFPPIGPSLPLLPPSVCL